MNRQTQKYDVAIVGAGLAGMTAAVELSDAGYTVLVLEANHFIGGRTSSWNDEGMEIESGYHRFLGFFTHLPKVLQKVGIDLDEMLCWEDEVEVRMPDGGIHAVLGLAPLHKPIKTTKAVLGENDFLTPVDKLHLGKMFATGLKDYAKNPEDLDSITVSEYAKRHNVSDRAIERILNPLTEGIFFIPPDTYSAYNLIGLFAPFIPTLPKLRLGAFNGGMSTVMMQPMVDFVQQRGGTVLTKQPVTSLLTKEGAVTGAKTEADHYEARQVILAASLHKAQTILRDSKLDHAYFKNMLRLPSMPVVTFQIELTSPCLPVDRETFGPTTIMTSFTEQSRTTFQASAGRLSIILAQPEKFLDMSPEDTLKIVTEEAKRLDIDLVGKIKDMRKVNLPKDYYSLMPGNQKLRPPQQTAVPGLTLAGDYTKQKYLGTMEGAAFSGQEAAKLVQARLSEIRRAG